MHYDRRFDVIVVGGGHAGTEAALASARAGADTLLLTQSIETLGQMSCNPAIGGIGKGHLVREIDALGGVMAIAADHCGIHFRTPQRPQGSGGACHPRPDRPRTLSSPYSIDARKDRKSHDPPTIGGRSRDRERSGLSVKTGIGVLIQAACVVMTVGTFLGGRIHVGLESHAGGRAGDPPSDALARNLRERGFEVGRLKTGTPPRIDRRSVDFSGLEIQPGGRSPPGIFLFRRSFVAPFTAALPHHPYLRAHP